MVRAGAPYALAGGVLLVALEALRQLFEPLERVAKQVISLLVLTATVQLAYANWDSIYSLYQVASGEKPFITF